MRQLEQSPVLCTIGKFSESAHHIASIGQEMAEELRIGREALNQFGSKHRAISRLHVLESRLEGTTGQLREAKREVEYFSRQVELAGAPGAKVFTADLTRAKTSVLSLAETERKLQRETAAAHEKLRAAGLNTRDLAREYHRLGRAIHHATDRMERLTKANARVDAAEKKFDKSLQRAAPTKVFATGAHQVGSGILHLLGAPLQEMRSMEAAKGELRSVGITDPGTIIERGQELSRQFAGIDTASFMAAAYDIKSGISSLNDAGIAEMTGAATLTAKATKSDVGEITSLFATAYGSFKKDLYAGLTDAQFGEIFSAQLAASTQQFKTTGAGMQQAIQSMGSGLAASDISLAEQLTGLGMLQQKMDAGVAGTSLKAVERSAAGAQERFADMGLNVRTLDDSGNLRSLPALLEEMQATFGDTYTAEVDAMVQKAFGSDEAVTFFEALWGQQDAFRANAAALDGAANQGLRFTRTMASAMDDDMDARLQVLGQRWDVVQQKLGARMIPILNRVLPIVERIVDGIGTWVDNNQGLATGIIAVAGTIGGLALIAAPVITSLASLGTTLSWLGLQASTASAAAAIGSVDTPVATAGGGKGLWGNIKALGRGLGGKLGIIGTLATGAISIGSTLFNDEMSGTEKAADIAKTTGTLGGGLVGAAQGAALGAALGSFVPVLGTAVGGVVGSILGGLGGSMAGNWLGNKAGAAIETVAGWFGDEEKSTQLDDDTPAGTARKGGTADGLKTATLGAVLTTLPAAAAPTVDLARLPAAPVQAAIQSPLIIEQAGVTAGMPVTSAPTAGISASSIQTPANSPAARLEQASAVSRQAQAAPAPAPVMHHTDQRQYTFEITQQPGEDGEALARRVIEMIRREDDARSRGALYDPI